MILPNAVIRKRSFQGFKGLFCKSLKRLRLNDVAILDEEQVYLSNI